MESHSTALAWIGTAHMCLRILSHGSSSIDIEKHISTSEFLKGRVVELALSDRSLIVSVCIPSRCLLMTAARRGGEGKTVVTARSRCYETLTACPYCRQSWN